MHMVFVYFQFSEFKPMMPSNLLKQLPNSFSDFSLKNPLAIFGCPHHVILGVIHTVAGSPCHYPRGFLLPRQHAFFFPPFQAGQSNAVFRKNGEGVRSSLLHTLVMAVNQVAHSFKCGLGNVQKRGTHGIIESRLPNTLR